MTTPRDACSLALAATIALAAGEARADDGAKVEAETLFQAGRELLANGNVDAACGKFEASQKIDRALGTMLRLADCYERSGRTASAWAMFREAASLARASTQAERAHLAETRASALEPKLARVELRVREDDRVAGLEITIGEVPFPEATWGVAFPIDPGAPTIRAVAPGRSSWAKTIEVPRGRSTLQIVEVPALEAAPPPQAPIREEAPPEVARVAPAPSPAGASAPAAQPPRGDPSRGSLQRAAGIVTAGVGLAATSVGGALGVRALLSNQASLTQCRPSQPSLCTSSGVQLRRQAQEAALGSSVAIAAGVTTLATGVIVYLTAPRGHSQPPRVAVAPVVADGAVLVTAGGAF